MVIFHWYSICYEETWWFFMAYMSILWWVSSRCLHAWEEREGQRGFHGTRKGQGRKPPPSASPWSIRACQLPWSMANTCRDALRLELSKSPLLRSRNFFMTENVISIGMHINMSILGGHDIRIPIHPQRQGYKHQFLYPYQECCPGAVWPRGCCGPWHPFGAGVGP